MKKSFNVNLGGRIFQIDEDAYEQLNDYIVSVKTCFMNNECGEEIAADIEARLGELFEARVGGNSARIITIALVNEMIARMGKPESIVEDEGDAMNTDETADNNDNAKKEQSPADNDAKMASMGKKLFRDGDNKILAGVVSGLAVYLGINITLLRVIVVFLVLISTFWALLIYMIFWAIVPLAITTTDKLRMQGVEPTPENIAEKLVYEEPAIDKIFRNLKEVDNIGIKNLFIILGLILLVSLFVISIVGPYSIALPIKLILCWVGAISFIAIPVIAITFVVSDKWKALSSSVKWLLLIDWILAFITIIATGVAYCTIIPY